MMELLVLNLVRKELVTGHLVIPEQIVQYCVGNAVVQRPAELSDQINY